MTIDNRPAPTDAGGITIGSLDQYKNARVRLPVEVTVAPDGIHAKVAGDGIVDQFKQPAIEPRTRVMLEALRRAFLMAAHAIGDYLGMERK